MTDRDYDYLRQVLRDLTGIVLEDDKQYLVESRLAPLLKRLQLPTLTAFADQLQAQPFGPLRAELIEALVTTESSFFRDLHPWEGLRQTVIPELMQRRATERRLTFWCAATAAGQEPYSLVMLLAQHFPMLLSSWKITILATDISKTMLERARGGLYTQIEVNRGLPAMLLVKYFQQQGLLWQLKDEIRRAVEFRVLNLCQSWPELPTCDVVMLRNVMIYFSVESKQSILERVTRVMRPDGYLMLGTAETTLNLHTGFQRATHLKSGFYQLNKGKG